MTVKVDLLPQSYRKARRRRTRCRLGVAVGVTLLIAELCVGIVLHARTAKTRGLLAQARNAHEAAESMRHKLAAPAQEAALLRQQVTLATRLRATHRWSRLLGLLGNATPEKVVLTGVATSPPRWIPQRGKSSEKSAGRRSRKSPEAKPMVDGIVIRGCAADHDDLSKFMAALQESGAFASIDLKDARRDQFLTQDAIVFDLRCQW